MTFLLPTPRQTRTIGAVLALAGLMATTSVFAQSAKVVTAYNYMKDGDLLKAKENIDAAAVHEKTSTAAKTWWYRGQIYSQIYFNQDPKYTDYKKEALVEAEKSYKKALDIPSKRIPKDDIKRQYFLLPNAFFQEGVTAYNEKDYPTAISRFETCKNINSMRGVTDSLAIYNIALSYENSEQYDAAVENYRKCIEIGYQVERVYSDMSFIYVRQKETDKAFELLKEARAKFPKNQSLLTTELNLYLESGKFEEALANLNQAIENDPGNAVMYYARGTIYNKKGTEDKSSENLDKAEADYMKAVELDGEYFDANYNLGALYYNRGADIINDANQISDMDAYNKEKAKADAVFEQSIPYLEKAHQLDPSNKGAMQSLKELYVRTGQTEKYNEMKEKLNN